jgi:hypothetical protein
MGRFKNILNNLKDNKDSIREDFISSQNKLIDVFYNSELSPVLYDKRADVKQEIYKGKLAIYSITQVKVMENVKDSQPKEQVIASILLHGLYNPLNHDEIIISEEERIEIKEYISKKVLRNGKKITPNI